MSQRLARRALKRALLASAFMAAAQIIPAYGQQAAAPALQIPTLTVDANADTGAVPPPESIVTAPRGQTVTSVDRSSFKNTTAFSIGELLALTPGVTTLQGNGPRDISISIRGSNERQTYGIRNAQVYEDGFPVTQPDGLARTDLTDPHAYESIDVMQGPSSALYGNYATGGAIMFHTRPGASIHGAELGTDFGGLGYFNDYITLGDAGPRYEYSLFASNTRGNLSTAHSFYNTATVNAIATYNLTPNDRLTLKIIENRTDAELPIRLSLSQYQTNPYQQGCGNLAAAGCASVSVFNNGRNGAKQTLSAAQAGLGRHDNRLIVGARWEHDFSQDTTWRTQFTFDDRDINQPTSALSFVGPYLSYNLMSDVVHRGRLFGRRAVWYAGLWANGEDFDSKTLNLTSAGGAATGGVTQSIPGYQLNTGAHARQEIELSPHWWAVIGVGAEYSDMGAKQTSFSFPATGQTIAQLISAQRSFVNVAPEAAVTWTPDKDWKLHLRVSTGYGTPQTSNLFTTSAGLPGNNTQLKSQSNTGVDLGFDWTPAQTLRVSAAGFYEFFNNELVTQSAGASLMSFTFNAPASEHRGGILGVDWKPLPKILPGQRFTMAAMYDEQIYTEYNERLSAGLISRVFNRAGNRIPGVAPVSLDARFIYDQPDGFLQGAGGFLEVVYRSGYYLDNANLIKAPSYALLNLNLHYDPPQRYGWLSKLHFYAEIMNLLDQTYVASASNITDTINPATGAQNGAAILAQTTGSIYAGMRRTVYGGIRVKF